MVTTTEVRQRAAELIEERGWSRYQSVGPNGEHCVLAALDLVAKTFLDATLAADELKAELGVRSLIEWNEQLSTSKAKVLAALRGTSL